MAEIKARKYDGRRQALGVCLLIAGMVALCAVWMTLSAGIASSSVDDWRDVQGEVPELRQVAPPPAVRRAGGRELREFKEARKILEETGCLACHRIGDVGNRRPGRALTHVGSELSEHQIRRALLHPRAPMPSFKGMPPDARHVLIRFLSLLR